MFKKNLVLLIFLFFALAITSLLYKSVSLQEQRFSITEEKAIDTEISILENITLLSAGQSINYFKEKLGVEKVQRNVADDFTEYYFYDEAIFLQVLVDEINNEVVYFAITSCDSDPLLIKKSRLSNYVLDGKEIILNKSTFKDIFSEKDSNFDYFIGNTANSYAYESLYLGNPGNYRTIIIGVNDVCDLENGIFTTDETKDAFREEARINTYAETSPSWGERVLEFLGNQREDDVSITFGVDKRGVEVL